MVLDPIPQSLPVHFFGSRPQPPTSRKETLGKHRTELVQQKKDLLHQRRDLSHQRKDLVTQGKTWLKKEKTCHKKGYHTKGKTCLGYQVFSLVWLSHQRKDLAQERKDMSQTRKRETFMIERGGHLRGLGNPSKFFLWCDHLSCDMSERTSLKTCHKKGETFRIKESLSRRPVLQKAFPSEGFPFRTRVVPLQCLRWVLSCVCMFLHLWHVHMGWLRLVGLINLYVSCAE